MSFPARRQPLNKKVTERKEEFMDAEEIKKQWGVSTGPDNDAVVIGHLIDLATKQAGQIERLQRRIRKLEHPRVRMITTCSTEA